MLLKNFLRPLAVACVFTATFSACSSGTDDGDTNVERGYTKKNVGAPTNDMVNGNNTNGDSVTAGVQRATGPHKPTGKELYKAAADAKDRNHDGLAD
jgi:hypothetical protein